MKKAEIKVGGLYLAKVSGSVVTVRVDMIRNRYNGRNRDVTVYDVTSLKTGRKTTFRSAAKFRARAKVDPAGVTHVQNSEGAFRPVGAPDLVPGRTVGDVAFAEAGAKAQQAVETSAPVCWNCGESRPLHYFNENEVDGICDLCDPAEPSHCGECGKKLQAGKCPHCSELHTSEHCQHSIVDDPNATTARCVKCGKTVEQINEQVWGGGWQAEPARLAPVDPDLGKKFIDVGKVVSAPEGKQRADPIVIATNVRTEVLPLEGENRPVPTSGSSPVSSVATVANASIKPASRLAGRIATTRTTRAVGSPVAGMTPNDEQEDILAAAEELAQAYGPAGIGLRAGRVLVVGAGAGTGKTATLKMLEQVLPGRGQYTAFNTSLVAESKAKFVKASCNTTHSLAFRAVGKQYQHRLGGERMRSGQIARILGIESVTVLLKGMGEPVGCDKCTGAETECERCNGVGLYYTDKPKTLQAEFLAGQVMVAVKRFCQSADAEIGAQHFRYIDGIDVPLADGKRGHENNGSVRDYLEVYARKAWADITRLDGQLPFSHDCYVKLWQLGTGNDRPIISADYILLDEAQDTAPVFLDVLKQQTHALLVLVGDDNQQIYEWRGAVNAMGAFPQAPRCLLSQSYRFGQAIADVANTILATLEKPTDLVMRGMPGLPSRVAEVSSPRCYLYRTNAGAVGRVMTEFKDGKRPHLIGGGADVVSWCQAALDLQQKRGTRHPELCCFDTWGEVVEYSKTDEGGDLKLMVKLVDTFGAAEILAALRDMPKEDEADLVVSTAHKSKGREWDTVKLGPDFPLANRMDDPDRRLLYVAATRGRLTLDVSDCPPFCGGEDRGAGVSDMTGRPQSAWVPGLDIEYTQAMPTEDEQAAWLTRDHATLSINNIKAPPIVDLRVAIVSVADKFTWTKFGNFWCVRGPKDATLNATVQVERRDGSTSDVTLRRVMHRYEDAWIYGI